jgi:hypothetical protein
MHDDIKAPSGATCVVRPGASSWWCSLLNRRSRDGCRGDHLAIPCTRHCLHAVDDSVMLLTVANPFSGKTSRRHYRLP